MSLVTFTTTPEIGGGASCHKLNSSGELHTTLERWATCEMAAFIALAADTADTATADCLHDELSLRKHRDAFAKERKVSKTVSSVQGHGALVV